MTVIDTLLVGMIAWFTFAFVGMFTMIFDDEIPDSWGPQRPDERGIEYVVRKIVEIVWVVGIFTPLYPVRKFVRGLPNGVRWLVKPKEEIRNE